MEIFSRCLANASRCNTDSGQTVNLAGIWMICADWSGRNTSERKLAMGSTVSEGSSKWVWSAFGQIRNRFTA